MKTISAAVLCVLGVLALLWVYSVLRRPLPGPFEITVSIPEGAKVLPDKDVKSGTFKVTLPLEEFLAEAAQAEATSIVTYGLSTDFILDGFSLNYWLPKDGYFYHANYFSEMNWPIGVTTWQIERLDNKFIVRPRFSGSFVPVLFLGVFLMAWGGVLFYRKDR